MVRFRIVIDKSSRFDSVLNILKSRGSSSRNRYFGIVSVTG